MLFILQVGIIKTIMIVDDEADVLEKVKSFLENDEIDVVIAKDSRQALELMDEENFDLILMDVVTDEMSLEQSENTDSFSFYQLVQKGSPMSRFSFDSGQPLKTSIQLMRSVAYNNVAQARFRKYL